ncbi:hypothetical protein [Rufibacter roseolus]|uniref:hypothetical protein n=1 Tax=Rufibacter roseolus TaxID=2817375 RepID=UPI001B304846|nr:hypothetical protein [Rufibacter roseolus]
MSKKHLYLPKLSDANVSEPKQNGHWEAQDKSIILSIAKGIEVAPESQSGVSSVPDAFARPLTFQSALDKKDHPMRSRVVQEWRGLLSLLALREIKPDLKQEIKFKPVSINPGDDRRLAKALSNLAPRSIRLQSGADLYNWTDFLLVQYEGVTLGAFSPVTLAFTSADYNLKLQAKSFPFKDSEGYLSPPDNLEDLESVGEWVQWFASEFSAIANTEQVAGSQDHVVVETINRELRAWLLDIKLALGISEHAPIDAADFQPAEEAERIPEASFLGPRGIYQLLLRPLKPDKNAKVGPSSDYALEVNPQRMPKHLEHVILIDAGLLGQNLKLWPGVKPAELGPDPIRRLFKEPSGTKINNTDIGKDKGLWIRPELYFLTSTLTKASGNDNFIPQAEASANGLSSRYLLPLRKEILQFFSVEDITDKLKPSYAEENDQVIFSMRLPLRNGQSLLIKKRYLSKGAIQAEGEGVLIEREVPVLELFPNYMGEFWARYYLLFSDTERLAATPVHFGSDHFYLKNRQQRLDTSNDRLKAELTRISGVDCFPEGIEIAERGNLNPVGLILVGRDRNLEMKSFSKKAIVGVDFGTSNTNVFTLQDEQAEPLALRFKSEYLRSLLAAQPDKRASLAQAFFVPVKDVNMPTPTALREYNPGVRKDLLLDYFLYFPDQPRYPENVLVDLKWEDENTENLNNYLEALVFLILVDLVRQRVGRIEFRCTYPKSFNTSRETDYRSKWESTLNGLFAQDGQAENLVDGQKLLYAPAGEWTLEPGGIISLQTKAGKLGIASAPKFVTEGIAAGEFFSNDKTIRAAEDRANKTGGSICIDVGGGTTDFSIWFGNEIKYDASVLLAGRQIAEVMARNGRIGDHLLSPEANVALRESKGSKFASRMNYILRTEHKEISDKLAKYSNIKDVVQLRRALVVEFGALAFYAGHLALALDKFLEGGFGRSVSTSGLMLHWGGNASKMLDWIDHGKFKPDGLAASFLNNLFACVVMGEVAPEAERMNIPYEYLAQKKQKDGQKNEAAGGIVVIDNIERAGGVQAAKSGGFVFGAPKVKTTLEGTVMGESVNLGLGHNPPYLPLLSDDLFKSYTTHFQDSNQSQLDYFLEVLNAVGQDTGFIPPGEQLTLNNQERMAIRNNVRNDFARLATQEPSQRVIEPVFIMEVRYLLNIMLEKML